MAEFDQRVQRKRDRRMFSKMSRRSSVQFGKAGISGVGHSGFVNMPSSSANCLGELHRTPRPRLTRRYSELQALI